MIRKIVLVIPNYNWNAENRNGGGNAGILWHFIPYNLCLLAAVLEQENRYEIKVIDALAESLSIEQFEARIREENPDFVGISVLMDFYGYTGHIAAKIVKSIDKNIITGLGGVHATANPRANVKDRNYDYIMCGEGEEMLPQLIHFINGERKTLPKGVWTYDMEGGHSELITDLDQYPLPAYHLIDYSQYAMKAERKSLDGPAAYPYARILTSRGCPYNCCFCQVDKIAGRKFRPRSAENVLKEIDWLINTYQIKSLIFDDDNLLTDRQRAVKIFKGLEKYKIPWKMIATAAFLLDDELIELMRKSGCIYVDIAVESGTERVLHEVIRKPLKLEKAIEVVKKLKQENIYVAANFIVGFPGETWEEIRQTIKFAEDLGADYIKLFNAVPLPDTRLYQMAKEQNALVEGFDSENINWRNGMIETDEFTARDMSILRAYEWDRINFATFEKRKRTADMMGISMKELDAIRKKTRRTLQL